MSCLRALPAFLLVAGCDGIFDVDKVKQGPPDGHIDAPTDASGLDPCNPTAMVSGPIHLTGTMLDSGNNTPLAGLSMDLIPGGVATTDSTGAFAIDTPSGNKPVFESLTASGLSAYPFHQILYQRPFSTSPSDVSSKLFQNTTLTSLYLGAGVTRDTSHATALISLRDCLGNGVAGATVSVARVTIAYQGGGTTTNGTGVAYALSIPPGPVTFESSAAATYSASAGANDMLIVYLIAP